MLKRTAQTLSSSLKVGGFKIKNTHTVEVRKLTSTTRNHYIVFFLDSLLGRQQSIEVHVIMEVVVRNNIVRPVLSVGVKWIGIDTQQDYEFVFDSVSDIIRSDLENGE